jgi:hypothetical protein
MDIPLDKLVNLGGEVIIIVLMLGFVLRIIPSWKEVRLSDNETKKLEAAAIGSLATALTSLANSQTQLAGVMDKIAVEQKQNIESVKILQRVNASSNEQLTDAVYSLTERIDRLEENQ